MKKESLHDERNLLRTSCPPMKSDVARQDVGMKQSIRTSTPRFSRRTIVCH
jgi:hypothetical protein